MTLTIGQSLYDAPRRAEWDMQEYKVIKIGRKWAKLTGNARCTIDTLQLDCAPYGTRRLYTNKEEYKAHRNLAAAWNDLRRDLSGKYNAPEGMTVEKINEARRLIGLEVFEVPA